MAESINHGIISGTAQTAYETAKGGAKGLVYTGVAGGLITAAVVLTAGISAVALGGFLLGGFSLATAGAAVAALGSTGLGLMVTAGTAVSSFVAGAIGSTAVLGPVGTIAGAVGGFFKGIGRVKSEKAAFENRESQLAQSLQNREALAAQNGFSLGVQAGQQSVMDELQRSREMQIRSQMAQAAGQKPVLGDFTAKMADKNMNAQAQGAQAAVG
jgi:hypothetical protein